MKERKEHSARSINWGAALRLWNVPCSSHFRVFVHTFMLKYFFFLDSVFYWNPNIILESLNVRMLCQVPHLVCPHLWHGLQVFYEAKFILPSTFPLYSDQLSQFVWTKDFLGWVGHPNCWLISLCSPLYPTVQEGREAVLSLFTQGLAHRISGDINNNNNLHLSIVYIPGPVLNAVQQWSKWSKSFSLSIKK